MNQYNELIQRKEKIIEQLKDEITYKPNRLQDISKFIKAYTRISSEYYRSEDILNQLAKCINKKPYQEPPKLRPNPYEIKDVDALNNYLQSYIDAMKGIQDEAIIVKLSINTEDQFLASEREHIFFDTYTRDKICNFIDEVKHIALQNVENEQTIENHSPPEQEEGGIRFGS